MTKLNCPVMPPRKQSHEAFTFAERFGGLGSDGVELGQIDGFIATDLFEESIGRR